MYVSVVAATNDFHADIYDEYIVLSAKDDGDVKSRWISTSWNTFRVPLYRIMSPPIFNSVVFSPFMSTVQEWHLVQGPQCATMSRNQLGGKVNDSNYMEALK